MSVLSKIDYEKILKEMIPPATANLITRSEDDFRYWVKTDIRTTMKLGEFRDLEEQGLLLRLPCKLGDDLYWISSEDEGGNEKPTIRKHENGIKHITITENGIWANAEDEAPTELDILGGEYALLTYDEAEEKLRELEGK